MWLPSTCIEKPMFRIVVLILCFLVPAIGWCQSLETVLMPGPVVVGHAKWEHECTQCHQRFDKSAQARLCADCHKEIAADLRVHKGFHGKLKDSSCRRCHTEHKGRKAKIINIDKDNFDHDQTNYPLKGAHREIRSKCQECHAEDTKFRDTSKQCLSCHRKDDVHKGGLGKECEKCHNDRKWKQTAFDHNKTRFKLQGEHVDTGCKACHKDRTYKETPLECLSCHKEEDKDAHAGRYGTKCADCHTPDTWHDSHFDHDRETHFRLRGKHLIAECDACHKGNLYKEKLGVRCVSCHRKDDEKKGHQGSLGDKCDSCHNEKSWKGTNFDHDADTDFPLEGKHAKAKCESCHKSGITGSAAKAREKLPTRCAECHKDDDQKNGHKGRFGTKCESCHTAKEWKDIIFDHGKDTKYVLRGKHAKTRCTECHTGSLYEDKLNTQCISCHRKDDQKKGHKGSLGIRCQDCHSENDWKVEKFDHNKSRFPLTGGHVPVECKKCHENKAFRDTPSKCIGCHEKEDVHKRTLGTRCEACHTTRDWKAWDFDHDKTRFRLDGAHTKLECKDCHKKLAHDKPTLNRGCISCHGADDVHEGSFGAQCERCHKTANWREVIRR